MDRIEELAASVFLYCTCKPSIPSSSCAYCKAILLLRKQRDEILEDFYGIECLEINGLCVVSSAKVVKLLQQEKDDDTEVKGAASSSESLGEARSNPDSLHLNSPETEDVCKHLSTCRNCGEVKDITKIVHDETETARADERAKALKDVLESIPECSGSINEIEEKIKALQGRKELTKD